MHRIAVAAALLLEGPWTLFILAPHVSPRIFAAATQVLLQIGILLTGNYNFFNVLTVVLALTLLDVRTDAAPANDAFDHSSHIALWVKRVDVAWYRFQTSPRVGRVMQLAMLVFCAVTAHRAFTFSIDTQALDSLEQLLHSTTIKLVLSVDDIQNGLVHTLPVAVVVAASVIVVSSVWQVVRVVALERPRRAQQQRSASWTRVCVKLVYLVTCSLPCGWIFTSSVLTLSVLDESFQHSLPPFVFAVYDTTASLRITSPYGLFRTMTGVGTVERDNGERISVVARPEIILEGTNDSGQTWRAYHFQYKPGNVLARPRRAMPLQPRLDWQMWFAALSDYHSAPWLVHLVHKLLDGSTNVKRLLDTSRDPFPDAPPQAIRAQLYYYDFTRAKSSWRHDNDAYVASQSSDGSDSRAWWTRVFVREYLPALERGNPSLQSFVEHHFRSSSSSSSQRVDGAPDGASEHEAQAWWPAKRGELHNALQVLVESEHSPWLLAAAVLLARGAKTLVRRAIQSRFQSLAQRRALRAKTE